MLRDQFTIPGYEAPALEADALFAEHQEEHRFIARVGEVLDHIRRDVSWAGRDDWMEDYGHFNPEELEKDNFDLAA